MSFASIKFLLFFIVVYSFLILFKLFKKDYRNNIVKVFLLSASYFLIYITDYRYLICTLFFTIITWIFSYLIGVKENKKVFLILGIVFSVLQLGVFKYFNFFIEPISNLLGNKLVIVNIIVPIGISFYTFSAISYIVDVYNKKCNLASILDYSLYISLFTKITCGPIVKPQKFLNELNTSSISYSGFEQGIQMFAIGLFKKMVIADHLAIFVSDVFNYTLAFNSTTIILGTITYSLQIYFDFSAYSEIAIGLSKMLGFNFDKNFNLPYISHNLTEFWKRWHISLSAWLQEYLYIPLGGNRKGKIRTFINLFLTMLIGGLWHGANWTFIIWGAINGLGLVIHKLYSNYKKKHFSYIDNSKLYRIFSILITFIFINFTWIFFRAKNTNEAILIINRMFSGSNGIVQMFSWTFFAIFIILIEILIAYIKAENKKKIDVYYTKLKFTRVIDLTIFLTFVGITIILAYVGETQFIYGSF